MNGIGGIAGSGAGLIIVGVCYVILHHLRHMPGRLHPWLYRLVIVGMFCGGCAIAVTALGAWIIGAERWAISLVGGTEMGTGHAVIVIGATFLLATVVVLLVFLPDATGAWMALALPFVLALTSGHLHDVLTMFPAAEFAQQVSAWVGG